MYVERLHTNVMAFIERDEKGETADETATANVSPAAP